MFRLTRSVLLLVVCCGITACQPSLDSKLRQCTQWMEEGQFSQTDSLLAQIERDAPSHQRTVDSLREIMRRWRLEFRYNETEMLEQLRRRISDTVSLAQMARWEEQGALEMRRFEGQKYYFKNALNNLIRLEPALQPLRSDTLYRPNYQAALIQAILSRSDSCGKCVLPVTTTLHYQITVPANAVPEGDTLRCWLPFTQEGNPRVDTVALLSTFPTQHTLSPQGSAHRSVYLEQVARKDQPTIFTETLRQRCTAQYFSKEYLMAHCQPYDTLCEAYRTYTAERPPHILFSPQIVHQAQALAEGSTNPVEIMTRIYDWIDRMPWASAIEYSVIPSIPTYVMAHQRGDCGQVSLLLISMLRSLGIPARWESGWILYPLDGETGLHDWASVYYEGVGWVPVDVSFGNLMHIEDPCVRHFFRSGIDNYRWIVNRDYGQPFVPIKQYLRSEPIDFQRGEVESTQGNLYFDQWSYDLQVSYETE